MFCMRHFSVNLVELYREKRSRWQENQYLKSLFGYIKLLYENYIFMNIIARSM